MEKNTFSFNVTISLLILNYYWVCTAGNGAYLSTDQHALEAIRAQITVDHSGVLSKNWTSDTSFCTWSGVSCGVQVQTQRVIALRLSSMGLVGKISPYIGNLSFLILIDLTNNSFHGSIPFEIKKLHHLEKVYMGRNDLTGNLPLSYFNNMPRLEKLYMNDNNFTGTLSLFFLDNMPSLKTLVLSYNSLHGNIPPEVGNESSLQDLYLNNNQFTGLVPPAIFNQSSLRRIELSSNALSGSLPKDMCDHLVKLRLFYISGNKFTGPIPSNIYKCQQLRYLSLSMNKFNSSIPREIGNLTLLKELFLGQNDLQGSIPEEIGNLKRLQKLSIFAANLVGNIPQIIFNMSSLRFFDISNNSLSGVLSPNVYINLPNLEGLHIFSNQFTGQVPHGFWKLKGIRRLMLSLNNFTGSIPPEVGNLTRLKNLYLGRNQFTGAIPDEICYLDQLEHLSLKENFFSGNIRFNISTLKMLDLTRNLFSGDILAAVGFWLPNLEELYLSDNKFHGSLPNSIINASKLSTIDVSINSFTGPIPFIIGRLELLERLHFSQNYFTTEGSEIEFLSSLTNCRKLRMLSFAKNPLNAFLPDSLGNLSTSLEVFQAFECGIKGNIPSGIGNLTSLRTLSLDMNELEGNIPAILGKLENIGQLYLESNRLQGKIPREFCLLKNMGELYLSNNRLSGNIPPCLGDIGSLAWLFLDSNTFNSTIPATLWSHKSLVVLNLSLNLLIGDLPSSVGSSNSPLSTLDLSFNRLSGAIPVNLGGFRMLSKLSLAHNNLQGSIPESIGTLISLDSLDLSQNNLSGVIPRSLEALRYLEHLNLSYNMLQGEIPSKGQFDNFTASSFMHNKNLCGAPRLEVLSCRSGHHESRFLSSLKYILPIIASAVGLASIVYLLRRHKTKIRKNIEPSLGHQLTRLSYYELVRATESFDESNLIGHGAYGSVYKGKLSNGATVAVKVFNLLSERGSKSFDVECGVLRNIRHRNLVRIISSCSNLDFRCLVMEYMSNGNLEQWLYSHNNHLSVVQRLQIMIDVASALEYLHHGQTTSIIHCDLKPSNVLLDNDMNARVCDFGIAKMFGEEEFMLRTTTLGTIGYMAPEYGMEGIVSTRADVYNFGILLLETFTRKKPTEEMFCGQTSLRSWVLEVGQHSIFDVVDMNLINGELSTKQESLTSIFNLAMDCTFDSASHRINMKETVIRLCKIYKSFVANN
ncbi:probable LRR receptor-like serine/threonine-protein kinase At3g47570 isoform X1 [Lactuca sativa]|uniref:probable LRR receptor-like serine/threonine-protein kinase At3g47570 isoform X1 n=1 Tax=Lactuca sativa TaxID=4236 RepID=UPI000CC303E6|nr:probable LRR receptor-like serine/threonine-protein kinase At3g47570 isoform X1 [Lactuca sativa]